MNDHEIKTMRDLESLRTREAHAAIVASLPFHVPSAWVFLGGKFNQVKFHNVVRCCQCGATIGRGRAGRRCKACREKAVDSLSDVALPYGFGGKPVIQVRIPGEEQQ